MENPVIITDSGIKLNPDKMIKEELYHCIYENRIFLFFKDNEDVLHCYEISDIDTINQIKQNPDNIDIDKFIADSSTEVKVFDEKEKARKEKTEYLNRILELRNNFRTIVFNNAETQEFVGTKIQYQADEDGKTIYDYINDPIVSEHIQFVVPEADPQDGSPVDQQISFFWKKPTY